MGLRASLGRAGWWRVGICLLGFWFLACPGAAAPVPSPPVQFIRDDAGVLPADARARLNSQLAQFERDTSSQVVVYVARSLPSDEELNSFVNRIFREWGIGTKKEDNGVLLAIFVNDRKLRIEVGRGLEGAIPDIVAGRIIANDIRPQFKTGDFAGGIQAGVNSLMAAARGEYQGTGKTRAESLGRLTEESPRTMAILIAVAAFLGLIIRLFTTRSGSPGRAALIASGLPVGGVGFPLAIALVFGAIPLIGWSILLMVLGLLGCFGSRGTEFSRGGRRSAWSGWDGGGFWGGGGGGRGGGGAWGGFSGGGGDSGGGGASGSW